MVSSSATPRRSRFGSGRARGGTQKGFIRRPDGAIQEWPVRWRGAASPRVVAPPGRRRSPARSKSLRAMAPTALPETKSHPRRPRIATITAAAFLLQADETGLLQRCFRCACRPTALTINRYRLTRRCLTGWASRSAAMLAARRSVRTVGHIRRLCEPRRRMRRASCSPYEIAQVAAGLAVLRGAPAMALAGLFHSNPNSWVLSTAIREQSRAGDAPLVAHPDRARALTRSPIGLAPVESAGRYADGAAMSLSAHPISATPTPRAARRPPG